MYGIRVCIKNIGVYCVYGMMLLIRDIKVDGVDMCYVGKKRIYALKYV